MPSCYDRVASVAGYRTPRPGPDVSRSDHKVRRFAEDPFSAPQCPCVQIGGRSFCDNAFLSLGIK